MAQTPFEHHCPCCGGNKLRAGKLGTHTQTFIPEGQFMWLGFNVKGFVCLDCRYVGHYLGPEDIAEIQKHT
jgi:hypothetical protein